MKTRLFVTLNLFQGRKDVKITFPAVSFELIHFNLAIPKRVRNDSTPLFVTLNLFQGRKDAKISLPAGRFELIYFNLAIPKRVRNDDAHFRHPEFDSEPQERETPAPNAQNTCILPDTNPKAPRISENPQNLIPPLHHTGDYLEIV